MIDNYLLKDFGKILKSNYQQVRTELGRETNVMRVYDRALDSLKFTVDLYQDYTLVCDYGETRLSDDIIDKLKSVIASNLYVSKSKIIYKHRAKGCEFLPETSNPIELLVKEDGALFNVELSQKMDTGLFLDNNRSRALIKELSFAKSVLNLFSYTGAYGVSASRGGAVRVVNVDTSQSALEIAKKNMEINGYTGPLFEFIRCDTFEYLLSCKDQEFDIIIFDAPTFSNSHNGRRGNFDVQKDHVKMLKECKRILKKDGIVLFRTSLSTFKLDSGHLSDFKIFNYTAEMLSPGFTRKSQKVLTYILRPYNTKTEKHFNNKDHNFKYDESKKRYQRSNATNQNDENDKYHKHMYHSKDYGKYTQSKERFAGNKKVKEKYGRIFKKDK